MLRPAAAAFALALFVNACTCGTSAPNQVFVCATGDDCAEGYVCDVASGTCVTRGSGGGSGGSGGGAVGGGAGGGAAGGGTGGGGDPVGGGAGGGSAGGTGGGDPDGGVGGGSAGGSGGGAAGGGGAGGGAAGGGGGSGGGGGGGGAPAGPPDRLAFAGAAQTLYTQTCSGPLNVEARTDAGVPSAVTVATNVALGPATVSFFSDVGCTTAASGTQITIGSSSAATTYFRSNVVGSVNLTGTSAPLLPAAQMATFVARPTGITLSVQMPGQLQAGNCLSAQINVRNGLAAANVIANTPMFLSEVPAAGLRYFSDAACTMALATPTVLAGQASVSFFVKPITGGNVTLTATSPWGNAQQTLNVLPAVRRGNCQFNTLATNLDCPFSPSQVNDTRTAVIAQISTSSDDPDFALATCELGNNNNRISCDRVGAFGTLAGNTNVHWQTLELPAGLAVRHLKNNCNNPPHTMNFMAVVPASSFILKQLRSTGTNYGDQELGTAVLNAGGNSFTWDTGSSQCNGTNAFDVQVVELSGISVVRGVADAGTAVTGLPSAGANRIALAQPRGNNVAAPVCSRLIRAEAATPSGVTFSRGAGLTDGGCQDPVLTEIVWERIDFGARATVQTFTTTLGAMVAQLDVPITAVDVTRTLTLSSTQANGLAGGETSYNTSAVFMGEGFARFELTSATNVRITRDHAVAPATFTFYVVQIEP